MSGVASDWDGVFDVGVCVHGRCKGSISCWSGAAVGEGTHWPAHHCCADPNHKAEGGAQHLAPAYIVATL